jgi:hypothetical protein
MTSDGSDTLTPAIVACLTVAADGHHDRLELRTCSHRQLELFVLALLGHALGLHDRLAELTDEPVTEQLQQLALAAAADD